MDQTRVRIRLMKRSASVRVRCTQGRRRSPSGLVGGCIQQGIDRIFYNSFETDDFSFYKPIIISLPSCFILQSYFVLHAMSMVGRGGFKMCKKY